MREYETDEDEAIDEQDGRRQRPRLWPENDETVEDDYSEESYP